MMVSKTVSISFKDLEKISKKIENEEYLTFSEFVQKAVKNELEKKEGL